MAQQIVVGANGQSHWADVASPSSSGFTPGYTTNAQGQTTYQSSPGNTVAKGSVFDPNSSNYNAQVANSNGKISLSDLDHSTANGLSSYTGGGASTGAYMGTGGPSIQSQIDQLKASQIAAATASLGKARDSSLSNLSAEQAKIAPQYYGVRNSASTQSQLGAKNFAEYMAGRGQTSSGVSNQAQISNGVALQGQIGAANTAEAGANVENNRQVTNVNNAYNSDLASAQAGAESNALQATITQMNADRAYQTQQDQFNVTSGQAQQQITNQVSQFAQSFGLSEKELANTITQQGIQNAYQDKAFAQAADQFAQQMGLSREQYQSSLTQWAATFAQSNNQFNVTSGQNQQQINNQASQFAQSLAASKKASSSGGGGGSSSSGGGSTATATQNKAAAQAEATAQINAMVASGQTPAQMQKTITDYSSVFTDAGLSISGLKDEAYSSYEAYHYANGGHATM